MTVLAQRPQHVDRGSQDALRHSYPLAVTEGRRPGPGDVARCGYVKRGETGEPGEWGRSDACVVCERLKFGG